MGRSPTTALTTVDPTVLVVEMVVVERAREIREGEQRNLAVEIGNAVARSLSG